MNKVINKLHDSIQIKVNESRLISNLGSVFTNNTKVLAELMQNARRAGATRIDVVKADAVLTISDNGSGIGDFQKLLTLAESGWDAKTVQTEGAYGMGFFSALFSAKEKVIVQSNGRQIIIRCDEDLLSQKIDILESSVTKGAVVQLHGLQVDNLADTLADYCKGFAVDVYLNGGDTPIPSPHRLNVDFIDFGAGKVRGPLSNLKKSWAGNSPKGYIAYLQGFVVDQQYFGGWRADGGTAIIHLDSEEFSARMPDRDCLINPGEGTEKIRDALIEFRKNELLEVKRLDPKSLFDYYVVAEHLGFLEIFNDIDFLPKSFFGTLSHPEKNTAYGNCGVCQFQSDVLLSKSDILDGDFYRGDPSRVDNSEHPYAMALMMAFYASQSSILAKSLHKDHWIYGITSAIHNLSDYDFNSNQSPVFVTYPEPSKSGFWNGNKVLLVDYYDIDIPDFGLYVRVEAEHGLAIGCDENACYGNSPDILLMPKGSDADDVLDQCNDWTDDGQYDERWAKDEKGSLDAYLKLLRGQNLASVLSDLLNDSDYTIRNALAGMSFSVAIEPGGKVVVQEARS